MTINGSWLFAVSGAYVDKEHEFKYDRKRMIQELEHTVQEKMQEIVPSVDIGIVGYGVVGGALGYGFDLNSRGRDRIRWYDKYKAESKPLEEVVSKSEFIFLTLPTPMRADHSGIDLSIIEENLARITPITDDSDKIVVLKSTVTPGTTASFAQQYPRTAFAFNPEFLTEKSAKQDFVNADRTVIGADSDLVKRRLGVLFSDRFPDAELVFLGFTSAEMVKLSANALLSSKVSMANQLSGLAAAHDVSWAEIAEVVGKDKRIGSNHLQVTSERGWGGKCFPKDLDNLIADMHAHDVDASIFVEVRDYNDRIRIVRDWEDIPFAVTREETEN